jgi:Fe-S-cluster containining protein|tara:strand:+ start:251 stop:586 length:336 start_codon:yes stop_codon:yes gene_type:complete
MEYFKWKLEESDINSDTCSRCGDCCSIEIRPKWNTADRRFMDLLEVIVDKHDDIEFVGDGIRITCSHLKDRRCTIYENRPQLCRDFNCVSWAKVSGKMEQYNRVLVNLGIE